MLIRIDQIGLNNMVIFNSKYGECFGKWMDRHLPMVNKFYHVEFDTTEEIDGNNIVIINKPSYMLVERSGEILISAMLYDYDDGCMTLLLEDNILEFLVNKNMKQHIGKYIMFNVPQIDIFDEHII